MTITFMANLLGTQSVQATKQNTLTTNRTNTKGVNFNEMLKDTLGSSIIVTDQNSSNIEIQSLTNEQLLDLKAFLQTTDLMQMDGGLDVLEQVLLSDDVDLESLVANLLNISEEELFKQLSNVLQIPESELKDLFTQMTNEEQTNLHLEQLLQNLFSQNLKKDTPINEQTATVFKAVKLIELIAENKQLITDFTTKQENKFIQAALEKVNEMLASQKTTRATYLNQAFSKIVTDLSQNSTDKDSGSLLVGQNTIISNNSLQWNAVDLANAAKNTKTNTDQLLQQFQSILAKGNLSTIGNTQKMLIRLYPENLGSLRIELIQKDDGLIARILTSTSQAKELLDSQLNVLRQAFSMQNIQVDKLEINQSFMQQQNYLTKDQTKDQNQSQPKEEQQEEETSFSLNLEELLNEEAII